MSFPKISVLIPVYNVEYFLVRCLESVRTQTFGDFEVILVDDGSLDSSGRICDEYAKMDSRFRVYHNANQNISATREFALRHAFGDYIQFVDSDDWIEPNMLECMYKAAVANNSDVVGCCFSEEYMNETRKIDVFYDSRESFLKSVVGDSWGVVWKLLIRRSLILINKIHFPSSINGGEDYYFVIQVLFKATAVVSIKEYLYHYNRTNISSTISTPNHSKILEQIEATRMVESYLINNGCSPKLLEALLRRKFYCKQLLLDVSFDEWKLVFPECNCLIHKFAGKKFRLKYYIAKIKNFFSRKR